MSDVVYHMQAFIACDGSDLAEIAASAAEIKRLRNAIKHYDLALKASWPDGAEGAAWDHWNAARAALPVSTVLGENHD